MLFCRKSLTGPIFLGITISDVKVKWIGGLCIMTDLFPSEPDGVRLLSGRTSGG